MGLGGRENSSNTRAKADENTDHKTAKGWLYQVEVETKEYPSTSNGAAFTARRIRRTVVTPQVAWQRVLTDVLHRGHDPKKAREIAWLEHKKTAMSYVYFCIAMDRLAADYPPSQWTLGRLKMLHTRLRNTNRNTEPKRLWGPGLVWMMTNEQIESQHTGKVGLTSPLALEQVYLKMGGYSIPSGEAMENQIIRSVDLERATRSLTPQQRKVLLLRSVGFEPESICRTLSISRNAYESVCRSLGADRVAGRELRKQLEPYGHDGEGRIWLQLRGFSEKVNRRQLYAYEAACLGDVDRGEPTRTPLTRFVRKWRGR